MTIYHRTRIATICVLATTALLVSVAIAKTELITNGTFETDTSGWNPSNTKAVLTRITSDAHSGSASLEVKNTSTSSQTVTNGAIQCINLSPVENYYTVDGWVKVPAQTNTSAEAFLKFAFYPSTDCGGSQSGAAETSVVSVGTDWTNVNATTSTSLGALSVEVRLYVRKGGSTGDALAYFDDISFFSSTATAVTLSSLTAHSAQSIRRPEYVLAAVFRWLWLMLGLAAAGGLTILKRRRPTQ